jgi:hypothetical protein
MEDPPAAGVVLWRIEGRPEDLKAVEDAGFRVVHVPSSGNKAPAFLHCSSAPESALCPFVVAESIDMVVEGLDSSEALIAIVSDWRPSEVIGDLRSIAGPANAPRNLISSWTAKSRPKVVNGTRRMMPERGMWHPRWGLFCEPLTA